MAIRFWGKVDLDAITRSFRELAGQEDFSRDFDFLTDAREAELALSTVDLNTFAGLYAELLGGGFGRSALVLNKPKDTALAYLHVDHVKTVREVRLFYLRESALEWLDSGSPS